jgi:hypothetical protein
VAAEVHAGASAELIGASHSTERGPGGRAFFCPAAPRSTPAAHAYVIRSVLPPAGCLKRRGWLEATPAIHGEARFDGYPNVIKLYVTVQYVFLLFIKYC